MRITPLEIRQHTFDKTFRGYDAESVDAFLLSLSQEWERVAEELRQSKNQLELAEREVSRMKEIETSLFKTLKIAETAQQEINDKAKLEADKVLEAAKIEAEEILNDARKKADMNIIDSENKAQFILKDAVSDLRHFEKDFKAMERYKDHLVFELKQFATETLDKVKAFEERVNDKAGERAAALNIASEDKEQEVEEIVPTETALVPEAVVATTVVEAIQEESIVTTNDVAELTTVENFMVEPTSPVEPLPVPVANDVVDDYDDEIGELPSVHAILGAEAMAQPVEESIGTIASIPSSINTHVEESQSEEVEDNLAAVIPSKVNKLTTDNDGKDLGLPTVSSVMNELTKENLTNGGGFVNSAASFFDDL
ncbi:MAG: DivIVA domain-containing protein [Flectobacillus sp.]|nr:DivIVA domain-containing protein [Flectobacillus sp.]